MMYLNRTLACLTICFVTYGFNSASAEETGSSPVRLTVLPEKVVLAGRRAEQRIIVTGELDDGSLCDLTADAAFTSSDPTIAVADTFIIRPVADGQTTITITVDSLTATVPVTVSETGAPAPISFQTEVQAALTKTGCNSGACHGSPSGKGGFRLSLRAYDPALDTHTLRHEYFARRTNVMNPDESLLLRKPLMQVAHGGGQRLHVDEAPHSVLRQWISEGLQLDPTDAPTLVSIAMSPGQRVFQDGSNQQQLVVMGTFDDGSVHDLTALTDFSSSNESVAKVDEHGLVTRQGRGESAILARYLDKMDTSYLTFLEEVPGFVWNDPAESNFIDRLVNDKLERLVILPSETCTDDEFIRRAYLDAAGRLPSLDETTAFLNDESEDKRSELVDKLLDTPDYAAFWGLRWADVLRTTSGKLKPEGVAKFNRWIYEGVLHDVPMDEFARELLTASGSVFENPAANYWRASRDPNDATETTAQLFLGVRIQCAKCHNHPFERWTQDNYYGIGAAFTRVGRKEGPRPDDEIIFNQNSGENKQPRTGETMKVHLLLRGDVDVPSEEDRREVFADWLTSDNNPFFAKAVVNRVWGHLFGQGIVEPVDDFRDSNPPSNAPLLDELARQFIRNGYSRKWLIREIMNSETYQRTARANEFNTEDERYTSHYVPRMLTAEQLLDAISEVTGVPESFAGVPAGTPATQLPEPPKDHEFLKAFGQPQREMACECERSNESNLSQALQMINGPTVHEKLRSDAGRIKQMMDAGKSDEEIVTELYLRAFSRRPSATEWEAASNHIQASEDRRLALEDVCWAVLNTKEFLFQH
ncbi:MAG: DUF1553 domain-containing protein [Planctomycetaceae bacterium]